MFLDQLTSFGSYLFGNFALFHVDSFEGLNIKFHHFVMHFYLYYL
jgi:hypothetical protein